MFKAIRKILSHDCGPYWQFVKYGAIGVGATVIQTVVFYILASTCLPCLKADDWAVKLLSLPSAAVADSVRAWRFVIATALAFVAANIPCWILNRLFVFRAGRYFWLLELLFFMAVSGVAMALATGVSAMMINWFGMMTTLAVFVEVFVSFVFNFFIRKFVIFKG